MLLETKVGACGVQCGANEKKVTHFFPTEELKGQPTSEQLSQQENETLPLSTRRRMIHFILKGLTYFATAYMSVEEVVL